MNGVRLIRLVERGEAEDVRRGGYLIRPAYITGPARGCSKTYAKARGL